MQMSKKNHGLVKTRVAGSEGGTIIMESYGKDDSDVCMSASSERGGKMGGSMTNLAHSITGSSANQEGS